MAGLREAAVAMESEKEQDFRLRQVQEAGPDGYLVDADQGDGDDALLKAADGHTILIPQPSDSPDDPLNWSQRKKHTVLFVIAVISFLPDYGSSMGAVTLIPQHFEWNLPENTIQHNLVGNLFCLAAGGLFAVALSDYFGRLPVLLWFHLIAFGTGIWCAVATSFNSYLAARIINGFFATVAQSGGLMWIKDMFFFHELPRKINLWTGALILAPYLGPFTAAFVISSLDWRWAFWIYTILNGLGVLLIIGLAEETFFDRTANPSNRQPWRSRWLRLPGLERHGRTSILTAFARPLIAVCKIPVMLVIVYYFLNFAWIIGVNVTISTWLTEFYHFKPYQLGLFYFSGITGAIIGEALGHWLHDLNGKMYMRRHGGRIVPEARLVLCYPASILMAVALLVLGFALEHRWHYMVVAVFAALQVAGVMLATVAVNAYLLDAYPEGSGEMAAWVNFSRAVGGFMASYIEIPWVLGSGPARALGAQAGITLAAVLVVVALQTVGRRVRVRQGRMVFPYGG